MRHEINALISDYISVYGRPSPVPSEIAAVIDYGIRAGYLSLIEKKNIYTFGGVSVSLTDNEIAEVMSLIKANANVAAIKKIRNIAPVGLKHGKDFVDHLKAILDKVD